MGELAKKASGGLKKDWVANGTFQSGGPNGSNYSIWFSFDMSSFEVGKAYFVVIKNQFTDNNGVSGAKRWIDARAAFTFYVLSASSLSISGWHAANFLKGISTSVPYPSSFSVGASISDGVASFVGTAPSALFGSNGDTYIRAYKYNDGQ